MKKVQSTLSDAIYQTILYSDDIDEIISILKDKCKNVSIQVNEFTLAGRVGSPLIPPQAGITINHAKLS